MKFNKIILAILFIVVLPLKLWGEASNLRKSVFISTSNFYKYNKSQEIEEFSKDFELVGTVIHTSPGEKSIAVIENLKETHQTRYTIGDQLPGGAKIVEILARKVILEDNGFYYILKLRTGSSGSSVNNAGYQKISPTEWKINPNQVFHSLVDVSKVFTGIKVAKFHSPGKTDGLRINEISEEHLFANIGMEEGDVIEEINNQQIENVSGLIDYFWDLDDEGEIRISLDRHGEKREQIYYITSNNLPSYSYRQVKQAAQENGLIGVAVNVSW